MKDRNIGSFYLAVLLVVFLSLIIPVVFWTNFRPIYRYSLYKFNIFDEFGSKYSDDEIGNMLGEVAGYIGVSNNELDVNFFSSEDILHMKDVKALFTSVYILTLVCCILIVSLLKFSINWTKVLSLSSKIIVAFLLLTAPIMLLFFNGIFTKFHEIFFQNDYWLLDPRSSNLIKFFPIEFFNLISFLILLSIFAIAATQYIIVYKNK